MSETETAELCPNCGGNGIGLLGIHEWQDPASDIWQEQEEWGTPCPNCGKRATPEEMEKAGIALNIRR